MIREAEIEGEACSTCKCAVMRLDEHFMPWYLCAKLKVEVCTPDETVCDNWKEIP